MGDDYYFAYTSYNDLMNKPQFTDNPDSVQQTINRQYWGSAAKIQKLFDNNLSKSRIVFILVGTVLALVVLVILITLCIRKRRKSIDGEPKGDLVTDSYDDEIDKR